MGKPVIEQKIDDVNIQLAQKALQVDLLNERARTDIIVTSANNYYSKCTPSDIGALEIVPDTSTPTSTQIKISSVNPRLSDYTAVVGDYVTLLSNIITSGVNELRFNSEILQRSQRTRNLFNYNTFIQSKTVNISGAVVDNSTYGLSDYIAVVPGETIQFSKLKNATVLAIYDMTYIVEYNLAKSFVRRVDSSASGYVYTVPSGVFYIRLNILNTIYDGFQAEIGSSRTLFINYGFVVNEIASSIAKEYNEIVSVKNSISSKNIFNKSTKMLDSQILRSGVITTSSGNDISDYIVVISGKAIFFSTYGQPLADYKLLYVYGFDANKNLVDYVTNAYTSGYSYVVPLNVQFIRICFKHEILDTLQVEYDSISDFNTFSSNIAYDDLSSGLPSNLFKCDKANGAISGVTLTRNSDGSITLNGTSTSEFWADYYYADISKIDNSQKMTLSGSTNDVIFNAYMREGRTSSALKSVTAVNNTPVTFTKSIYTGGTTVNYLTLSLHIKSGMTFNNVVIKPMLEYGDKAHGYVQNGKVISPKAYVDFNTYSSSRYKLNMFENVIFCGDSVTEGYVVDGSIYTVESKYSYPTQFGKLYPHLNITNKGQSGITPKQYYTTLYPTINFALYDLIFVELGYNGTDAGYLALSALNTAGTNTNYYKLLIEGIRQQNPNAEVILVCSSKATNLAGDGDWLPVLKIIASANNCKVINLMDTKYIDLSADKYHGTHDGVMDYIHFTRKGYNTKAYVVSRMVEDVLD